MTLVDVYIALSAILLLWVAMIWSSNDFANTAIKIVYYITATVGLVITAAKFIPGIV